MAQRQWRSDDTVKWRYDFGKKLRGDVVVSSSATASMANAGIATAASGETHLTLDSASTFTNGMSVVIHQSRGGGPSSQPCGTWDMYKIISGGGTTTLTLDVPLVRGFTDSGASQAQVVEILSYGNLTINEGVTWTVPAWDGNKGGILALMCNGEFKLLGTMDLSGTTGAQISSAGTAAGGVKGGFRGGYGHCSTGSNVNPQCGEGTGNASYVSGQANGNGGGASTFNNGTLARSAGGGGNSTAGHVGTAGDAGLTSGNTELTIITFGGAGAGGGRGSEATTAHGAAGGASGGAIGMVFARKITFGDNSSVNLKGGPSRISAGQNNGEYGTGSSGGAGAGGSFLGKCENGDVKNNKIDASGGSRCPWCTDYVHDGAGGPGRVSFDVSGTLIGTSTPTLNAREDKTVRKKGLAKYLARLEM